MVEPRIQYAKTEAGQILAANVVRELAADKQFLFSELRGEEEED